MTHKITRQDIWDMPIDALRIIASKLGVTGIKNMDRDSLEKIIFDKGYQFESLDSLVSNKEINNMSLCELRLKAKLMGKKGFSKMTRDTLVSMLTAVIPGPCASSNVTTSQQSLDLKPVVSQTPKVLPTSNIGNVINKVTVDVVTSPESTSNSSGVEVKYGVENENLSLAGYTLGDSMKIISEYIKIPEASNRKVVVNGKEVPETYILQGNDVVEIVKPARHKG